MKTIKLSNASLTLLMNLVADSGNWGGCPMVDISKEERGNLTDLKRKGLIRTSVSDGTEFATFTFEDVLVTDGLGITHYLSHKGYHVEAVL